MKRVLPYSLHGGGGGDGEKGQHTWWMGGGRKTRGMHFCVQGQENTLRNYRSMCPGDVCQGSAGVVFPFHSCFLLLSVL